MINSGEINGFEINGSPGGTINATAASLTLTPVDQMVGVSQDITATADSLTLTPAAQDVRMHQTYDVVDTAVITSSAPIYQTNDEVETAVITNPEATIGTGALLAETAVITNTEPIQVLSDLVTDTAPITSTAYPSGTRIQDSEETAVIVSAATTYATTVEDIAETAVIVSSVTQPTPSDTVTETAVITSSATYTADGVLDVAETAVITSSAEYLLAEEVTETAVITSATTLAGTGVLDVAETAVITSNAVLEGTERLDVLETAVISSIASHTAAAITDLLEEAFISSAVFVEGDDVWTANTITWAMSTYTGLTMTDATDKYAVSEDGLFSKATTYANMNIDTGHADMGSPNLKTVQYAYTYAEHTAPMGIAVTADVKGAEHTHAYKQMSRTATDKRAVRCTFGRGFRSSYYKLNFTSSGYAQISSCVPVVDELSRRI